MYNLDILGISWNFLETLEVIKISWIWKIKEFKMGGFQMYISISIEIEVGCGDFKQYIPYWN